jgi:glycosyltransferase involved in cell wall biosynthesis
MKVLHISTSDINGGAARAAYRLHQGLQKSNAIESYMLVQNQASKDRNVISQPHKVAKGASAIRLPLDKLPLKFYKKRKKTSFSIQWLPDFLPEKILRESPDVIHLHWVNQGFMKIETLEKFNIPVVWTLHDMWPFTGGCHYTEECSNYQDSCGRCPQLGSLKHNDLSKFIWSRKEKSWKNLDLTIVSPSRWMAASAAASSLFKDKRIEVIPHGLNLETYKPIDKNCARSALNLPPDMKIILFGAVNGTDDPRKGFKFLISALKKIPQTHIVDKIEVAIFGHSRYPLDNEIKFKCHYLGGFQDDISLSLVYSAADVMIVPSIQESFGQTASEALACGLPVVAFDATGLKDIVDHKQNGYLAKAFDVDDLSQGISWILEDSTNRKALSVQAREKAVEEYSLELQSERHLNLYKELLEHK